MLSQRILTYNLRSIRARIGKTQEEMARSCGVSYRLYQKLEAGKGNPTLLSLDRIARAVRVPVSELLRLIQVRAPGTRDEFVSEFAARMGDGRFGAALRTLDGVVVWGNRRLSELTGRNYERGPVDLMTELEPVAREMLRFQLECERRDIMQPYVNLTNSATNTYLRFYPTSLLPPQGDVPYFSAVYITDVREDTQKNYVEFCEKLLRSVQ